MKNCSKCKEVKTLDQFRKVSGYRHGIRSYCDDCARSYSRDFAKRDRMANRDKLNAKTKEWHKKNREHSAAYDKARRAAMSPEQLAAHDRRRNIARYGITVEAYEAMFRAQNGACAICRGNELSGRRLAVDHCHTTGTVRGLLCAGCNRGIGYMGDSVQNLNAAAEYLTRADEKSRRGNIEVNGKGDI